MMPVLSITERCEFLGQGHLHRDLKSFGVTQGSKLNFRAFTGAATLGSHASHLLEVGELGPFDV